MTKDRKPEFFYGYIVVLLASLIMAMTWGSIYSFGIFFKPVLTEFGWTRAATSGAYSLVILLQGFIGIFICIIAIILAVLLRPITDVSIQRGH